MVHRVRVLVIVFLLGDVLSRARLAVADENFGLFLLTKAYNKPEDSFAFGGGRSGHHGRVNDMAFCGGQATDSARYLATASGEYRARSSYAIQGSHYFPLRADDKMLFVWDLQSSEIPMRDSSYADEPLPARPKPELFAITFPYPLSAVCSHPSTSREFLVADARGSVFLTDWRSDPEQDGWRHQSVIELVEPRALADAVCGQPGRWSGSIAWRRDSVNM